MPYEILASKRELQGTGASRRLRKTGQIPAVVYGNNQDAVAVTIEHKVVFYAIKDESFHSSIIHLSLDGKIEPVMMRDFQMHPFKPQVMHVDFQRVDLNTKIRINVALHFINAEVSPLVKLHGGRVSHLCNDVEILVLPKDIPAFIDVDLSKILPGQHIHLSDLNMPIGVELVSLIHGENLAIASASGKAKSAALGSAESIDGA